MSSVVLDTHAAVWWSFFPRKLSRVAARAVDGAQFLVVPAIVLWEVALLVRKNRLELPLSAKGWLQELKTVHRVKIVELDADLAIKADELAMHEDPADRFIVATAISHGLPLVTKDRVIRESNLVQTLW